MRPRWHALAAQFNESGTPATKIKLHPDAEYRELAQWIQANPEWRKLQGSGAAARKQLLGRLMIQALDRAPRGQAAVPVE